MQSYINLMYLLGCIYILCVFNELVIGIYSTFLYRLLRIIWFWKCISVSSIDRKILICISSGQLFSIFINKMMLLLGIFNKTKTVKLFSYPIESLCDKYLFKLCDESALFYDFRQSRNSCHNNNPSWRITTKFWW